MTINSPALYMLAPISEDWVFEIGAVYDNISGASPYYHSVLSGASGQGIKDGRIAGDFTLTKYFGRTAIAVRGAYSHEDDYKAAAGALDNPARDADQNTTFSAGIGYSNDTVSPADGPQFTRGKSTFDAIVGISQYFTPNDFGSFNLYFSRQEGYLSDPYKALYGVDQRPEARNQYAATVRWNHYFSGANATMRTSYRFYDDDWEIQANTFIFEWAQELPQGFT